MEDSIMKINKKILLLSALLLFGYNTSVKAEFGLTAKESFQCGIMTQSLGPITWGPGLMANTMLLAAPGTTTKEGIKHSALVAAGMVTTAAAQVFVIGTAIYGFFSIFELKA
jgi:hypothetical protein